MRIVTSDETIWYWYNVIEKFLSSQMTPRSFCDSRKLNLIKFGNMRTRIEYRRRSNPEWYERWVPIAREYMESGMRICKFLENHDVDQKPFTRLCTHLRYLDVVERIRADKGEKPTMSFIQIPSIQAALPRPLIQPEPEVVEPQNDIEIVISKGVKVSISPNIDSMKIIKIIELLKDL